MYLLVFGTLGEGKGGEGRRGVDREGALDLCTLGRHGPGGHAVTPPQLFAAVLCPHGASGESRWWQGGGDQEAADWGHLLSHDGSRRSGGRVGEGVRVGGRLHAIRLSLLERWGRSVA